MINKQIPDENWCPLKGGICSRECMFWVASGCHFLRALDKIILMGDVMQGKVFTEVWAKYGQKKTE